jgi:hypothetical protein
MTVLRPSKIATKQEFIQALRSGQYEQCNEVMKNDAGQRCALGVFHAISGDPDVNDFRASDIFPAKVFSKIALLNDIGKTFNEIADLLEIGLSEDLQSFHY